jgi:hypothetical protein
MLLCFLLVGGVNFMVRSSCEMPSYDVCYMSVLLMFCWKDVPDYRMRNFLFPTVIVVHRLW